MEISVESLTCNPGETVKTAILLARNPGIASVKLLVEYDSGALRYGREGEQRQRQRRRAKQR